MAHYFDENPEVGFRSNRVAARIFGIDFEFETGSGVFSQKQLDYGTKLLLETVICQENRPVGRLLDLGCGYGPVGIVMKRVSPALDVVMCDVNTRALQLAEKNRKRNYADYVSLLQSDVLSNVEGSFDLILTNPPIRAGKKTVFKFFEQSAKALNAKGRLYVVIQKKQGAPSAFRKISELFGVCEIVEKSAGYWILKAVKSPVPEKG